MPIPTENQFPGQTLVACLVLTRGGAEHAGADPSALDSDLPPPLPHPPCVRPAWTPETGTLSH